MSGKTDLEILTGNDYEEVEIRGEKIRIEPVKVKNLSAFATASRSISGVFMNGFSDAERMEQSINSITEIIVAGSPLSAGEVAELNATEALAVFSAVISVNTSFFVSSVLPAFQGGLKTLTDAMAGRK